MKPEISAEHVIQYGPPSQRVPDLSVLMLAYNHENYIRKAIDSVFSQTTSYSIELVIGEDCSTDDTRQVIEDQCASAPVPVRLITARQNVGMHENMDRLLKSVHGKYVAILEGDDYWIDSNKLQKQIKLLDDRPEFVACFHDVYRWVDGTVEGCSAIGLEERGYSLADLVEKNVIPTCSLVYRRRLVPTVPIWAKSLKMADWPINAVLARHGELFALREPMAVYRQHSGGVWSGMLDSDRMHSMIKFYEAVRNELQEVDEKQIARQLSELYFHLSNSMKQSGQLLAFLSAFMSYLRNKSISNAGMHWGAERNLFISWLGHAVASMLTPNKVQ